MMNFFSRRAMSKDFDGVHFMLDGVFGASAMLGVAWVAAIVL